MRNPLRECPGKGDKPRNCHNPKFRKNWDKIKWGNTNDLIKKLNKQALERNEKLRIKISKIYESQKPYTEAELKAPPVRYQFNNIKRKKK